MSLPKLKKDIETALKSGKYKFGVKDTIRSARIGDAKLIVLANNVPERFQGDIEHYAKTSDVPIIHFEGSSKELGEEVCGRLHFVSAIAFNDLGYSELASYI